MELMKYWFFYLVEDGTLYAYTADKRVAKAFRKVRKETLFAERQSYLSKEAARNLFVEDNNTHLLNFYTFQSRDGGEIVLAITQMERLDVENTASKAALVDIFEAAVLPPKIFTPQMQEALYGIGYMHAYSMHHTPMDFKAEIFKPDYYSCFLFLYGDTIKVVKK